MLKPGGYTFLTSPEGQVEEGESYTCRHCNRITFVKPRQRPEDIGGLCKQCMGLTCPACTEHGRCTPLERKLEQIEKREIAYRSYGVG